GHDIVSPLAGAEVAQRGRVPGISQLPPDVNLPGEVGGRQEIRKRVGKKLAGAKRVVVQAGSGERGVAESSQLRAGPDRYEGEVGPAPLQYLVIGDLDVLSQHLQLQVVGEALADQIRQDRIREKLVDTDLR